MNPPTVTTLNFREFVPKSLKNALFTALLSLDCVLLIGLKVGVKEGGPEGLEVKVGETVGSIVEGYWGSELILLYPSLLQGITVL